MSNLLIFFLSGLAVENLDTLLADMETFNSAPLGKKLNSGRKIKIEIETDDNLEKKLDNLTDKLMTAFDAKSDVKWKDTKEENELGTLSVEIVKLKHYVCSKVCAVSASQ